MVDPRRLDMRRVRPRPTAATPGDLGSGGNLDEAERDWLDPNRAARRRTALLVGLAVVAVIVLAYRRLQR